MSLENASGTGKPYIAIACGRTAQRRQIASILAPFYQLGQFYDVQSAVAACRARLPAVAVVGEELPTSNGYDFVHMLRLDPSLAAIPVLMMVANDDAQTRRAIARSGTDCHLPASCAPNLLASMVSGLLNRSIEDGWQTLPKCQSQALTSSLELFNGISTVISHGEPIAYQAISNLCKPLVDAVASADFQGILHGVKHHDNYTYAHSVRVATLLTLFGCNLGLSKDEQVVLASGGLLHDVGKIAIPNEVLNKAGRLTSSEFLVMKGHVDASITYLQGCHDLPKGIMTIAAQHHEKLNGTGYPNGLRGNRLDKLARMASIIDVFSALTDRRVYKPSMDAEMALKIMTGEMSSHLDMTLLHLFRQMLLDTMPAEAHAG